MATTRSKLVQVGWLVAFGSFTLLLLVIFILAYNQLIPVQLGAIPYYDKAGHFFLLGIAGYLSHRAAGRRHLTVGALSIPIGPLAVALIATAEESLQAFSPNGTLSATDLAADMSGILFFYWLDWWLARRRGVPAATQQHIP